VALRVTCRLGGRESRGDEWRSLDGEPVERHDRHMSSADDSSRERRLLLVSVWASAGFAAGSTVWGLLSGSAMIVFDGLYSFVSIGDCPAFG
jgi:hypothetical protein